MYCHGEFLACQMGRADGRTGGQVPHAYRVPPRAEVEGPVQQVPVDRADQRPTVGRYRGEREQVHALQPLAYLLCAEPTLIGDNSPQMRTGFSRALIEKLLQAIQLVWRLQHEPIPSRAASAASPASRAGRTAMRGRQWLRPLGCEGTWPRRRSRLVTAESPMLSGKRRVEYKYRP